MLSYLKPPYKEANYFFQCKNIFFSMWTIFSMVSFVYCYSYWQLTIIYIFLTKLRADTIIPTSVLFRMWRHLGLSWLPSLTYTSALYKCNHTIFAGPPKKDWDKSEIRTQSARTPCSRATSRPLTIQCRNNLSLNVQRDRGHLFYCICASTIKQDWYIILP